MTSPAPPPAASVQYVPAGLQCDRPHNAFLYEGRKRELVLPLAIPHPLQAVAHGGYVREHM